MSFLPEPGGDLDPGQQAAWDRFTAAHPGRLTNMKSVLLEHLPSFRAYMEWYELFDALAERIGERAVELFSYAISDANDCLICSVYFRRILIDSGEDPDDPRTTAEEDVLLEFGRAIARSQTTIPDELITRVEEAFPDERTRLVIVAFAGQMVATNLLNSVGRIPLDDVLSAYRRAGDERVR